MDPGEIGRRVAYWRTRRGLTQADLAQLMGRSRRWVQDLEGGQRQQDPRLSVLRRAASVLRIPMERLVTDTPSPPPHRVLPAEVAALADSLHHLPTGNTIPVDRLRRRVHYHCQAWAACHYSAAARGLSGVLADARATTVESEEGAVLLSRAYQLAASLFFKYGEAGRVSGVLCADRALAAAERSGDPVAIGAAARRVARGLMHRKRYATAAEYATTSAITLRPGLETAGPDGLATLGMLYLVAAVAGTGDGRSPTAVGATEGRLAAASEIAERQSGPDADFTGFGATNVALHRVDTLLRLDDAYTAIEVAQRLEPAAVSALGRERRARHLITVARARALTRERALAERALLDAERLAPEEVHRPAVTQLVGELMELASSPSADLTALAGRCGLRS
ncbi:helix-turn-helix domain-containing protein [Streptomyces sp. ST2-7A]|uniref:helix-turn-helix domain-containing protein n=1 Tax=Streptomyces sp. ST2-7A TaxID=2907214 RepID=UPI001F2F9D40|nr:helix-turn-helix transcriptional regulator [Streptomyces sp. ST2-7A]MCE7082829.1 helix-turn-helix domain-containing protein [Streptomyces sp. ST2-7A]